MKFILFTLSCLRQTRTFFDCIFVLSESKRAVNAIRNEYSLKNYAVEYEWLDYDKEREIRDKILLRLMEIKSEL